ncbi:MAG: LysM peptidoglycan-binding domain-containing protein, partial [Methylotenera sp.]|nr:LysM peptidoglycan-binding domain-containing protein [Methylotenera sp.]
MRLNHFLFVGCLISAITACSSNPPAPVIDRIPSSKPSAPHTSTKPAPLPTGKPTYKGDWRPSTYVVKKGDTLFGIGLEYGYDYKELAQANNIPAPYNIRVGQIIKLEGLDDKSGEKNGTVDSGTVNSDGVVTYPINGEPNVTATPAGPPTINGG